MHEKPVIFKKKNDPTKAELEAQLAYLTALTESQATALSNLDVDIVLASKVTQLQKRAISTRIDYDNQLLVIKELEDVIAEETRELKEVHGITVDLANLSQSANDAEVQQAEELRDATNAANVVVNKALEDKQTALRELEDELAKLKSALDIAEREAKATERVTEAEVASVKKQFANEIAYAKENEEAATVRATTALVKEFDKSIKDLEAVIVLSHEAEYTSAVDELTRPKLRKISDELISAERDLNATLNTVKAEHSRKLGHVTTSHTALLQEIEDEKEEAAKLRNAITKFQAAQTPTTK